MTPPPTPISMALALGIATPQVRIPTVTINVQIVCFICAPLEVKFAVKSIGEDRRSKPHSRQHPIRDIP
jgi:hypothetical protein